MCGIQDIFARGRVDETANMLHGMVSGARREMKIRTKKFKEWDYWYDKQCKAKKRKVKRAMKEYKKGDDGTERVQKGRW
jgi:hypothetical protein